MTLAQRTTQIAPSPTLAMAKKAKEMQAAGIDVINLGVGEPDFTTPNYIVDGAKAAMDAGQTSFYTPTAGLPALRQAIAADTFKRTDQQITAGQVVVTAGAKLALYALMQVLVDPNDIVVTPAPYWVSYSEQVKLAGGRLAAIVPAAPDLKITPAELGAFDGKIKVLILNSPNNPTGAVYSRAELSALLDWADANDVYVILDEIYGQLVYNDAEFTSGLALRQLTDSKLIIIDGVSKAYAMTGWRIGWALADTTIINAMSNLLDHMTSNPSAVAQYAALTALTTDSDALGEMRLAFEERLNATFAGLQKVPHLTLTHKPQGAFYLFPKVDDAALAAHGVTSTDELALKILTEAHVALPAGEGFGMPGYLRLGYAKDQATLDEALRRLTVFFEQ